jgi:hypothetical protein
MPNWCYNNMTIHGKTADLRKFVSDIKVSTTEEITKDDGTKEQRTETRLSIASLYPVPEELTKYHSPLSGRRTDDPSSKELSADDLESLRNHLQTLYGATDWYNWCLSHWGTKWGDSDTRIEGLDDDDTIPNGQSILCLYYETAWSPASGLIAHVSKLYPSLAFYVVSTEEAELYACWQVFHNGEIVGEGEGETEVPDEISVLADKEETMDDYYEKVNDWQCERNDELYEEASKCLYAYLDKAKERREALEYAYKVRLVNLMDERDKALAEFDAREVILNRSE